MNTATALSIDPRGVSQGASATSPDADIQHHPARRLAAFATLSMPIAAVEVPLGTYVPPLYASALGFNLSTVGIVFLVARLWDAVIDPGIGILSDRTRSRWGRRRPWIAVGGVVFGLGAVPVFLPPSGIGPMGLSAALFVMYLGYSAIATPYAAWSGELSSRYHERTRVVTFSMVMTSCALLLALILPSLLAQRFAGQPRLQLAAMGAMVFILLIPSQVLGLRALPEPPAPAGPNPPLELAKTFRLVFGDRLLLRVLASNFAVRLGQGIRTAVFVFFVTFYTGKPTWAPALFLLQYLFGILAAPIWHTIGKSLGKSRAAVAGELVQAAINFGLLLVTPHDIPLLLALTAAQGLAQGSGNLMLRSIVADVADHHHLATGQDRIGLFFSVFSLSDKAAFAVAIGVALPLVAWLGFDPQQVNAPGVLEHLKWVFALGPALAHVLSAALINGFPINERNHAEIRRMLAARDAAGLISNPRHEEILARKNG